MSYKELYSRFLTANEGILHFAAHSHHYWPDVTREAVIKCWDDAARYVDDKWQWHIMLNVVPQAQQHIARILGLNDSSLIALAPNTHELVTRLISAFDLSKPLSILTTDSEFNSFARQCARLEEISTVSVTRIPVMPFGTFEERFKSAIQQNKFDFIFFSHVFFNSGFVVDDFEGIVNTVASPSTIIVIDGYHGFCAIPTSLQAIQNRIFYVAGGYKYAQSGEGVSFMTIPSNCDLRPLNTGWFAEFGALEDEQSSRVSYSDDAFRFWGATFDPTGLYRFNAVMDLFLEYRLSVRVIHDYVSNLMDYFLGHIRNIANPFFNFNSLIIFRYSNRRGHFLSFEVPDADKVVEQLRKENIVVDARGSFIRFGFGLYHNKRDIALLIQRLTHIV